MFMNQFIKAKPTYYMNLKNPDYTLDEVFTGRYWLDDKPIFRKVFQNLFVPFTAEYYWKYNVSSVDVQSVTQYAKNITANITTKTGYEGFTVKLTFDQADVGRSICAKLNYELDMTPTSYDNGFLIRNSDVSHSGDQGYKLTPQAYITNTNRGSSNINFTITDPVMYFITAVPGWNGNSQVRIKNLRINEASIDTSSIGIETTISSKNITTDRGDYLVIEYTKISN